jgi:hypothetical protein
MKEGRWTLASREMEEQPVQPVDARAHEDHDQPSEHADQRRQSNQTRFARPYEGP